MNDVVAVTDAPDLAPRNFSEVMEFAQMLATSGLVPKDYQGKPEACAVAMQWGNELGLKPMQSLQNIAVINGRPSLWGDSVLALVISSPACKDVIEYYEHEGTDDLTAVCIAQRHGKADKVARFSLDDAKTAGLLTKEGPWQKYPPRMLKMRARGFALRDQFSDVLRGIPIAELVRESVDMGAADEVKPPGSGAPAANVTRSESIKAKLRKGPKLQDVIKAIDDAQDAAALRAAGELGGKLLDEGEKEQARKHWEKRRDGARTAKAKSEPTTDQADAPRSSFAQVADALRISRTAEDVQAAELMIAQVESSEHREELGMMVEARLNELNDAASE